MTKEEAHKILCRNILPCLIGEWREAISIATKALEAEPHWIPCEERLPEVSGCYLVSVKNDHKRRYSKTAWFEKGVWFARQDVVAWMPLPEPMRMEKQ